ncbi:MAG: hypothetical protein ACR2P6_04220, partial [Gammaproteobacteria bacterium]
VANLAHTGELYIWNARAGIENERWTLTFYVDNILEEDAPTLIQNFPVIDVSAVAVPWVDTNGDGNGDTPGTNPRSRLFDPELQQLVYPNGLQLNPRRGTNIGALMSVRF